LLVNNVRKKQFGHAQCCLSVPISVFPWFSSTYYTAVMPPRTRAPQMPSPRTRITNDLGQALTMPDSQWNIQKVFRVAKQLGKGGDGEVAQWTHVGTNISIAVKSPSPGNRNSRKAIQDEIRNFRKLKAHGNIVYLIAYNADPIFPQLFLELCELGSLLQYRKLWCRQEKAKGRLGYPTDVTIWKLLKDMSLALHFMHFQHAVCHVHTDLKPDNILVVPPHGWNPEHGIPMEPVFKVTDFARLTVYPAASPYEVKEWFGTSEYGPPIRERSGAVHPAVDIWGLGATIQWFKTGHLPIQSKRTYLNNLPSRGKPHLRPLTSRAWYADEVRWNRVVVYRPLDVSAARLRREFDLEVGNDYKPSSSLLEHAYRMLWHQDPHKRITSRSLVTLVVPGIDRDIAILKSSMQADDCRRKARELREAVTARQVSRLLDVDRWRIVD